MEKLLRVNFDFKLPQGKKYPKGHKPDILEQINQEKTRAMVFQSKVNSPKSIEAQKAIKTAGCTPCLTPAGFVVSHNENNTALIEGLKSIGASVTYLETAARPVPPKIQGLTVVKRILSQFSRRVFG